MRIFKQVLSIAALLVVFSGSAYACYGGAGGCGCGCGCGPTPPTDQGCDNPEDYNESFETTDFTYDSMQNKYYFGFDPITEPGEDFKITSITLTVTTNSNGAGNYGFTDSIWAKDSYGNWHWLANLLDTDPSVPAIDPHTNQEEQDIQLSDSFFDDILNGKLLFKAWFSRSNELITLAELTVNGTYCPPTSQVPIPGAVFLFAPAMLGLIGLGRRKKFDS